MKSVSVPFRALVLALGLALSAAPAAAAPRGHSSKQSDEPGEKVHIVAQGHTLAKIAKRYKVSIADLREANGLSPGERLKPGTRLVIPSDDGERGSRRAKSRGGRDADSDGDRDREDDERESSRDRRKRDRDDDDDRGRHRRSSRDDRDDGDEDDDRGRGGKKGKGKGKDKGAFVHLVHGSESWQGQITDKKGKLSPRALDAFSRILKSSSTGKKHAIEPRLVSLVGLVSEHFGGRTIEVVSGFRPVTKTQFTAHSRHNTGSAIDFHIKGVPNEELRDFCRTLKNTGVGYYPNSSFVHLDVRDSSTYWVDMSKPGEAPRYQKDGEKGDGDNGGDGGEDHDHEAKAEKDSSPTASRDGSRKTQEEPTAKN